MPVDNASAVGTVFDIKQLGRLRRPRHPTTVFLKGCPLRCMWCHNPEGLSYQPQLMVSMNNCLHCGACVGACPNGGKTCTACGRCIRACPRGCGSSAENAIRRRSWPKASARQGLSCRNVRRRDLSGGEPTGQPGSCWKRWTASRDAPRDRNKRLLQRERI